MHSIWHKFKHKHKIKHKHNIVHLYSITHQSPDVLHTFHIDNNTNILQIQHFLDLYNLGKIHSICVSHDSHVIQASIFWNTHNSTFKFTCPVTGYYYVTCHVIPQNFTANNGNCELYIRMVAAGNRYFLDSRLCYQQNPKY